MRDQNLNARLRLLTALSLLLFAFLEFRLFQLQIVQTEEYRARSEANSVRVVEEIPGRGIICDRNGRVLVENRPSYSIFVIPYEATRDPKTLTTLASVVHKPLDDLSEALSARGMRSYQPVKISRDIPFEMLAALKARTLDLPGVTFQFEPKRFYPYPVAPHILGYIGEISESEKRRFPDKKPGDIVGKSGVERTYENLLAGRKGYRYLIVNALGQVTGELKEKYRPPYSSGRLYLTIDLELQQLAESLMEGKRGAVAALDPRNGEILALASAPKYDPNIFTGVLRSSDWRRLQDDPDVPLLNRAIQSGYPPASTFKMVTLAAAFEEGVIDEDYRYYCTGSYRLGRVYHCFKRDGHGWLTPVEAIEQSCDAFFYKLGHQLGVEKLSHYARLFGFGSRTGIDLENEIEGLVPDRAYLDERYGENRWSVGLALNIAIGQGEILVTPLQLAQYCAILATGGELWQPHLFLEMAQDDGGVLRYEPEHSRVPVKPEVFALLRRGMRLVLEGDYGTAKWLRSDRWHMAGKTGTAQNPHGEDHALFIGFAPFDDPVIAVAVVVENAGFGSTHAAPIAVELMKRYLEIKGIPESGGEAKTAYHNFGTAP